MLAQNCFKEEEEKEPGNTRSNFRVIDTPVFKIPTNKPSFSENLNSLPKEGVGLLEFSQDDSLLAFRNGTFRLIQTTCPIPYGSTI